MQTLLSEISSNACGSFCPLFIEMQIRCIIVSLCICFYLVRSIRHRYPQLDIASGTCLYGRGVFSAMKYFFSNYIHCLKWGIYRDW